MIERAVLTSRGGTDLNLDLALPGATVSDFARDIAGEASPVPRILTATQIAEFERENVERALEQSGWKISGSGGAAELLGLNPNTLSSRLKALGIDRRSPR